MEEEINQLLRVIVNKIEGLSNRIEGLIVKENKDGKIIEHGIKMSGGGAFSNKLDALQKKIDLIEKRSYWQEVKIDSIMKTQNIPLIKPEYKQ